MRLFAVCVSAFVLFLVGCGAAQPAPEVATDNKPDADVIQSDESAPDTSEAPDTAGEDALTFSLWYVDPETSPYVEGGHKIAEYVGEATDGRIRIEVHAGDELGERGLLEAAMYGIDPAVSDHDAVDIATCANSVLTNYIPQMNILDQAYLWKNADEAHAAVDGALGDLVREQAEKLGLHVIGFEESGFRNTFSTRPIRSKDDFSGVTIRTMENKYHRAAFEAFGATVKEMKYDEVMPALEAGEIDACENATANCLNSGYYTVTKNVTNTQHAFVYILLCMSDDAWNRIPEELREPFLEAVQRGVEWERARLVEANAQAEEELRDLGVQFFDIDVSELQQAYKGTAAEEEFVFDAAWQQAVDEALQQTAQ